jgi:Flp pilus assembly protein TadD
MVAQEDFCMPVISSNSWPRVAVAVCALLGVVACAPNSARTPLEPRLAAATDGEREQGRYGMLLRLAASARAAGDPAAAVSLYQQAIAHNRSRIDAYVLLGDTLLEMEAFNEAASTFQEALGRDPKSTAAHRGYARAMLGLNRPEVALVHYQTVLDNAPHDLQAHNGLGVALDLSGQHDAAQDAYRAGLATAPDSMLLRNNLGLSLALSGDSEEAIEVLRAVADEPGAKARNRQNLALAYGLAGDLAAAERVSRIDLDEESVQNNLSYFAALAAVDDGRKRAAVLGVHAPELTDDPTDGDATRRLAAIALEGDGLELGLSPTGRWFVDLGEYGSAERAAAAWRQLRVEHKDLLGQFGRLAGVEEGRQPLLVGPLAGADQAQTLCGDLERRGQRCRALPL